MELLVKIMSKENMLLNIEAMGEERMLNIIYLSTYFNFSAANVMLPLNSADDSSVALTKLKQAFSIGFYEVAYKIFMSRNVII